MSRPVKILILGDMNPSIEETLADGFELLRDRALGLERILADHGAEIRAIVTRGRSPISAQLMDRLPALELIVTVAVGYDSTDVAAAVRRGIVVTNTPDVLNDEMADFTIGLLLATVRRLPQADNHVRAGLWAGGQNFPLSASLRGRTIGIAGMGRIGTVIARRLEGFDVPVAYYARRQRPELRHAYHDDLLALVQAVDTLIVVLPGGGSTHKIIDAKILAALGPDGILINVARGSVIDEQALIAALQTGGILAAGLDVFACEPAVPEALLQMDQVVLLPHIGTATHHTRTVMAQLAVRNVVSWFDRKRALTPVPECAGMISEVAMGRLKPGGNDNGPNA